jgi:hypothetical protein
MSIRDAGEDDFEGVDVAAMFIVQALRWLVYAKSYHKAGAAEASP